MQACTSYIYFFTAYVNNFSKSTCVSFPKMINDFIHTRYMHCNSYLRYIQNVSK